MDARAAAPAGTPTLTTETLHEHDDFAGHGQQGRSWLALLMLVLGMATIAVVRLDAH
jgi:hypothetical protein